MPLQQWRTERADFRKCRVLRSAVPVYLPRVLYVYPSPRLVHSFLFSRSLCVMNVLFAVGAYIFRQQMTLSMVLANFVLAFASMKLVLCFYRGLYLSFKGLTLNFSARPPRVAV